MLRIVIMAIIRIQVLCLSLRNISKTLLGIKNGSKGLFYRGYIEHFGKQKLNEKFKGQIGSDKLENLELNAITILLFGADIIDQPTYAKINEIRDKRNHIIHNVWEKLRINPNEAETLIKKAIECIEKLGA
jgi:hypothetical protein